MRHGVETNSNSQIYYKILNVSRNTIARVAQWIAHQTSNLRVVGSSPTVGIFFLVNYELG